ncbi:MAG: hypothetical protein LCH46_15505 [Proteobacteria bacterium]|nr:hypothetical protein [Pseudomonadota bacterium]
MAGDNLTSGNIDLDAAVAAGVIDAETAARLRSFAQGRMEAAVSPDDEQFRLLTGFGDIFVTIGLVLFLGALGYLSGGLWAITLPLASWGLAEVFTRIRRQALPSIALLVIFAGSVFAAAHAFMSGSMEASSIFDNKDGLAAAGAGLVAALAVGLHWWRFHVPITIAAGAAAAVAIIAGLVEAASPGIISATTGFIFLPLGLAVFALAMFFDSSDRLRQTRRTDIAFWLHLLAAPMIVHPIMQQVAHTDAMQTGNAITIVAVFLVMSFVALTVDRRALLVSSLIYLGYGLLNFVRFTQIGESTAVAVLLVGATVLGVSIAWKPLRAAILKMLPPVITSRVPPAGATYSKPKAT